MFVAEFLFRRMGFDMKKFLILIIFLMMSRAEAAGWSPELRIGILSGVEQFFLQVSAPCIMIDVESGEVLTKIPAEMKCLAQISAMKFNSVEIRPEEILIQDLRTTIGGKEYCGGLRLNKVGNSLTVINLVPAEEYLRGVLPKEMSPSYPLEALKAQAVAARSFALKNRGKHKADGFDLCSSTHCQVYDGAKFFEITDAAVEETRGEILTYKDKLIETSFHADSGGMTENSSDVWGRNLPCLAAVKENFETTDSWTIKIPVKKISETLKLDKIKSVKLSKLKVGKSAGDRTSSGRVKIAQINGKEFTGLELRQKFSLPSTLFDMKLDKDEIIFTGYGRGHGVGMSQKGAKFYAADGWSYEKILSHYYKGTKLKKLY